MSKLAEYAKFVIATVTPVFLVIQAAVTDGGIDQQEWTAIAVGVLVAVGVLLKGNRPPAA